MKLTNPSGSSLELQIVGYQFPETRVDWANPRWQTIAKELGQNNLPENADDWYDRNWLIVQINAVKDSRAWTSTDPCLLTNEWAALARWHETVRNDLASANAKCDFIEPALAFELIRNDLGGSSVRVYFSMEARPKWSPALGPSNDLWIDFPLLVTDLDAAIKSLWAQHAAFPVREGK